ncbi:GNAT family N-acetyltransferase [Psychromonas sp. Urea-02u-13]|uniref:GNAT family N-acetyltransferase n=1 Tax=Psychromonas sp. Urea-02u-13 TaxID=2058326 RepID=UPI000C349B10|nr:GNAT family N-acetyltransferase [Psychromonas sp. Urea-02u-13]PKG40515.1 GNAT family N-acetyltransferase [Psychromonas sp. Urea-02u-13]
MDFQITPIGKQYDAIVGDIIKAVGAEHGAIGEGFGPSDLEVTCMSEHYHDCDNSLYLVALIDGKVVGGCGIAQFADDEKVCELRKLFLLPESRGLGLGKTLTESCLTYAKSQGYLQCYLDTLSNMQPAIRLYEGLGFKHLTQPLAETEHSGCDVWMLKAL